MPVSHEYKGYKQLSLRERAAIFSNLIREPGWELLQRAFRPEIRTRITDTDAKEALLYEAVRAQIIQEIFSTPHLIINQAEREWSRHPIIEEAMDELDD
jgi:hypothetical protein